MFMFIRILSFLLISFALPVFATPTTLFWTTVTTDIQPTGVLHFGVDDYFSLNRRDMFRGNSRFPTDVGLTYGLFDWNHLKGEIGVDYFGATLDPWYFNAKAGIDENVLFEKSPAFAIGINNMGTRHHESYRGWFSCVVHPRTDQNVAYYNIGKTIYENLRLFAGGYHVNSYFGEPNGFQLGIDYKFAPTTHCDGVEYFKWELCADWATGKNIVGGEGVAVTYYFTPDITVETGPVWFNSTYWNGRWKWSIQFNMDVPVL